jgi:predicted DNA-binding protein (MmcQ/YjbR family)
MKYGPQTTRLLDYVKATYDTEPEFLWARTPDCAVLRNNYSRKWYGIIMVIPANKIGIKSDEKIEIINVRFSKGEASDFASNVPGIYPAWHMNKKNWITIVLDSTLTDEQLFGLVEQSYSFSG